MQVRALIHNFLFKQVDNTPLIVFRVLFGILVFLECAGAIVTGWVEEILVAPEYPITFIGFEWLSIFTGNVAYVYYAVMALTGVMIMFGYFYRIAVALFTCMWWGCYLMQKTHYNNHYYLMILVAFIMLVVPAHQYFSLDVKRKKTTESLTCSRWCLLIFIFQLWVVFTYASIAKINPDWLAGKPVFIWFSKKTDYPVIGFLFEYDWLKWVIVYSGILFDLLIVPLLLWKRTRLIAFIFLVFFNLFNAVVFQIGTFPFMVLAFSVFFIPSEKLRAFFFKRKNIAGESYVVHDFFNGKHLTVVVALVFYCSFQILVPLRHYLYEGDVSWTEEGYRMSWHMMLRTKSGHIHFEIKNAQTGQSVPFNPENYFTRSQMSEIAKKPDMIWQSAQIIRKIFSEKGIPVKVYAYSNIKLNGRAAVPLVNPEVNLAAVEWESFKHSKWILPIKEDN